MSSPSQDFLSDFVEDREMRELVKCGHKAYHLFIKGFMRSGMRSSIEARPLSGFYHIGADLFRECIYTARN